MSSLQMGVHSRPTETALRTAILRETLQMGVHSRPTETFTASVGPAGPLQMGVHSRPTETPHRSAPCRTGCRWASILGRLKHHHPKTLFPALQMGVHSRPTETRRWELIPRRELQMGVHSRPTETPRRPGI